jgi:hypothetical protein
VIPFFFQSGLSPQVVDSFRNSTNAVIQLSNQAVRTIVIFLEINVFSHHFTSVNQESLVDPANAVS